MSVDSLINYHKNKRYNIILLWLVEYLIRFSYDKDSAPPIIVAQFNTSKLHSRLALVFHKSSATSLFYRGVYGHQIMENILDYSPLEPLITHKHIVSTKMSNRFLSREPTIISI